MSVSGYCFTLNSGPVSCKSKKQSTIALSSCETEYISLTVAVQEGLFLTQLMRDMDFGGDYESFSLQGDNQGSLSISKESNRSPKIQAYRCEIPLYKGSCQNRERYSELCSILRE